MKIIVIGGSGQIGSRVISRLGSLGHEAVPVSLDTGVDVISGKGLAEALAGADVVVDVTNRITMDEEESIHFFGTAARNIAAAEIACGVSHHVALSVLRSERLTKSGYIAGKVVQEAVVEAGSIPYSLVHAAQFFELVPMILDMSLVDGIARISDVRFQPIAADDVADALVDVALGSPVNGVVNIAGPQVYRIDDLARHLVAIEGSATIVEPDPSWTYFGAPLEDGTLLPDAYARIMPTTFDQWAAARTRQAAA
jgi:uncharacterized protein YbjT (DUF2867 family)